MFNRCTSLVEPHKGWLLPVKITNRYSCYYMFSDCSKLQKMAVSYSGTITTIYWQKWLYNVSSTGTFYYSKNQIRGNIQSIVPSGWTLVQSSAW